MIEQEYDKAWKRANGRCEWVQTVGLNEKARCSTAIFLSPSFKTRKKAEKAENIIILCQKHHHENEIKLRPIRTKKPPKPDPDQINLLDLI